MVPPQLPLPRNIRPPSISTSLTGSCHATGWPGGGADLLLHPVAVFALEDVHGLERQGQHAVLHRDRIAVGGIVRTVVVLSASLRTSVHVVPERRNSQALVIVYVVVPLSSGYE